MSVDQLLRRAVRDLADEVVEPRLGPLAHTAIRRGHRLRRRRARLTIGATALAVLTMFAPYFVMLQKASSGVRDGASHPTVTMTSVSPFVLTALGGPIAFHGWIVASATRVLSPAANEQYSSVVYDQSRQRYVALPFPEVVPAPTGTLVAVYEGNGALGRYGVLNLADGNLWWIGPNLRYSVASAASWSDDGRQLALLPGKSKVSTADPTMSVLIVNAATRAQRELNLGNTYCADLCRIGWYDDGTLMLPHSGPGDETKSPPYDGVRLFSSMNGHLKRSIDLPGAFTSTDDWSTDRRYVVLASSDRDRHVLYDSRARTVVRDCSSPQDTYWISRSQMIVTTPTQLNVFDVAGTAVDSLTLPMEFSSYDSISLRPA